MTSEQNSTRNDSIEITKVSSTTTSSSTTTLSSSSSSSSSSRIANNRSTHAVYDPEMVEATALVDNLLRYTQSLMESPLLQPPPLPRSSGTTTTVTNNGDSINGQPKQRPLHHIVAFSGGIDSSVVAALVHQVLSSSSSSPLSSQHRATAVLGVSPAVPHDQIRLAETVANTIGIEFRSLETTEGHDPMYVANAGQACLACKTHLYRCLQSIAQHYSTTTTNDDDDDEGIDSNTATRYYHPVLYNGTNADDVQDVTRVGLSAATQFHVRSPLRHTTKRHVRLAGRHLGLMNWNHAASPCLRSRLALGVPAVPHRLGQVESAESFVRSRLMLRPHQNMRVRLLSQNRAMIEVDDDELLRQVRNSITFDCEGGKATEETGKTDDDNVDMSSSSSSSWRDYFVRDLGFASVDVRRFKTGSVARRTNKDYENEQSS